METTVAEPSRATFVSDEPKPRAAARLFFVDNIRVLLTILVVLHHLTVIYAGTGGFYYREGRQDAVTDALGGWFCAVNQSFFMGLFLLISAYFVPGSLERKGAVHFIQDRLVRLGIPLAVYGWIINPIFVFLLPGVAGGLTFWRFFPARYFSSGQIIGFGPTWFIETLLIFSLVYVAWHLVTRNRLAPLRAPSRFPSNRVIAVFALLLGLVGFLVRIFLPMDSTNLQLLNLQIPFFAQYIALFIVGLIAYRRDWLISLPDAVGRLWVRIAGALVLLWAPMMVAVGAIDNDALFKGGLRWQSLMYSLWESFICLAMSITVIYAFRRCLNRRGRVLGFLVPNAYTTYLIHPLVITSFALAVRDVNLYPLLKLGIAAVITVPLCFLISALIRKIPCTDRVL